MVYKSAKVDAQTLAQLGASFDGSPDQAAMGCKEWDPGFGCKV